MTLKRHLYKSGKNYAIHTYRVEEKKMDFDKQVSYIQQSKDPYKEEFNRVAKILDNYANETNLSDADRLFAIRNIIDSMLGRPHTCGKVEDKLRISRS